MKVVFTLLTASCFSISVYSHVPATEISPKNSVQTDFEAEILPPNRFPAVSVDTADITVSTDTVICQGDEAQLEAAGGDAYFWSPAAGLSCTNCPNPIASPDSTTVYTVSIVQDDLIIVRQVEVKVRTLELGPTVNVCANATFDINPNPDPDAQYIWSGTPGLSCSVCPSPVVSGLTPGTYILLGAAITPECFISDVLTIQVQMGQQPQYHIASDTIICAGQSIALGGMAEQGTQYFWSSKPAGFSDTTANPVVMPSATTRYFLEARNKTCAIAALDSITVVVSQPPNVQIQADTAICVGEAVLLAKNSAEPGVSYQWTPNNGTLNSDTIASPLAITFQNEQYSVTAIRGACTITRNVDITVVALTLGLNVEDTVRLCKGESIPIQALVSPASIPINWLPVNNLQISPDGKSAIASPLQTTRYIATATQPGCVRRDTVVIFVDSLPNDLSILPKDTVVCPGALVQLTSLTYDPADFAGIEFSWSPFLGQVTSDTLYNLVVQPDTTTIYQRITISGACVDTQTVRVNVYPKANLTIEPGDTAICPGQNVKLELTYTPGVSGIQWTPPNSLSCSQCDSPLATPTGTTTYQVTGNFFGCPVSANVEVEVKALPPLQFPSDVALCFGESVILNVADPQGATYVWTSTDPTFGTVTDAQPVVTPTQSAQYFVTANNGCILQSQIAITINSAILEVSGDTTICANSQVVLTASGTLPGSFFWSNGSVQTAQLVTPAENDTFSVIYTFADGCQLFDTVTITVLGASAAVDFPDDLELCPGESIQLNNTANPGTNYLWSTVPPSAFNTQDPTPIVAPTVTTTYKVTSSVGICTRMDEVVVTVYNANLTITEDTTICRGEAIELVANGFTTGTYEWNTGSQNPVISPVVDVVSADYSVTFTYGNGQCTQTASVTVNTAPNFNLAIVSDPDSSTIFLGQEIDLTAIVTPTQNLDNFNIQWSQGGEVFGSGETAVFVASGDFDTLRVVISATSPSGCAKTEVITFIVLLPDVQVPTAFTPNGDQVNDSFLLAVQEGLVTVDRMQIFNRWGAKIFESSDPNAQWDGRSGGEPSPPDVYFYRIWWRDGLGALRFVTGEVTLLR